MQGRTHRVFALFAGLGLGFTPLACGDSSEGDAAEAAAAAVAVEKAGRYSVRLETGRPERLVAEVQPAAPWTLDMDSAAVVVLGEAEPQPAERIAAGRILFDVRRATGARRPRTGILRFGVCGKAGCEPVEYRFRIP